MGLQDKIKIGEKISVLLEKIEDKNGEVLVSALKAHKIKVDKLVKAYENNEPIMGKITSKCNGIVEHIETGSLMFLLISNSDKP